MQQLNIVHFDDDWNPDPAGLNWRAVSPAERANESNIIDRAWVRYRSDWGGSTFKIVAWNRSAPIGENDPKLDYWELPLGTRSFTAEGRRERKDTVVSVALLQRAK